MISAPSIAYWTDKSL